ncbi:MAG: ankyrin repeat domain-containing protein [Armatimonadetes bacterium]|nr:ankyrin repeat domain-containing protein [Armatimonadota bacterium]CUU35930.1 Ankyrin repeat-containing protein [Armatimonadetes bacterium DC]
MQTEPEGATQWQKVLILGFFVLPIVLTVGVLASPWFRELRSHQLAKNDQLIEAVESGDIRAVEQLLQQGANVNARTRGGLTALSLAVIRGHDAIALTLIERGASLDARDRSGDRQQMSPGYSPVHYAAIYGRTRVLERMLQAGVSPDLRDKNGRTLLMLAAENGHTDTVRLLLRHGANPRATSALGETVLDCARRGKNPTVIRLIEAAINSPESGSGDG